MKHRHINVSTVGFAVLSAAMLSLSAEDYILWSTIGSTQAGFEIKRARRDGSDVQTLIHLDDTRCGGIAVDPQRGHIYSGNWRSLFRMDWDGKNRLDLVETETTDVELDLVHDRVYWANFENIYSAKLDGSDVKRLAYLGPGWLIEGIAVDAASGKLYYAHNAQAPIIGSMNLDGSGIQTVWSLEAGSQPFDVEFDSANGKLYWNEYAGAQVSKQRIRRGNADGSGVIEEVLTPQELMANGMGLDAAAGIIYYPGKTVIRRVATTGSGDEVLVSEPMSGNYIEAASVVVPARSALALYAGVTITGEVGRRYEIQSAGILQPTNWKEVATIILPNSPYLFLDTNSPATSTRFYQVIPKP